MAAVGNPYVDGAWIEQTPAKVLRMLRGSVDEKKRLADATHIYLRGSEVNDEDLNDLPPNIRYLDLQGTAVTDKGTKDLPLRLVRLNLCKTGVTDAGIKDLPPNIRNLFLEDTDVTDEGVKAVLQMCPELQHLKLTNTKVKDFQELEREGFKTNMLGVSWSRSEEEAAKQAAKKNRAAVLSAAPGLDSIVVTCTSAAGAWMTDIEIQPDVDCAELHQRLKDALDKQGYKGHFFVPDGKAYQDVNGHWTKGRFILDNKLVWETGEETSLRDKTARTFNMTYKGNAYTAELQNDGKLYWSDGDCWSRTQDIQTCDPEAAAVTFFDIGPLFDEQAIFRSGRKI